MDVPDPAAEYLLDIGRRINDVLSIDPGMRLSQGAVGTVTALRGNDDARYVLKLYRSGANRPAATECEALRRIRDHTSVPVPRPIDQGIINGRPFLLMTHLTGARWADRRDQLGVMDGLTLAARSAHLLRKLHVITNPRFGPLLRPDHDSAWTTVRHRCATLIAEYVDRGGATDIAARIDGLVRTSRPAIDTCDTAALCHNDFVDGNILIEMHGPADITGIVDLEAASWNDPLADVANAAHHLRRHNSAAAAHLIETYGVTAPAAKRRLAVHDALHILHQRNWIAYDKPSGWQKSIMSLDRRLRLHDFTDFEH